VVLAAVYLFTMFRRVFHGECTKPENQKLLDLNARELVYLVPLLLLMLWIGLYPKPYLGVIKPAVDKSVRAVMRITSGSIDYARSGEKAATVLAQVQPVDTLGGDR
jgi:NADH-quinone oxidoreductase subunit M